MELLLSRHGNTFAPGDTVTWAGSKNDLPLVESGYQQAERLAAALKAAKLSPAAVYCGPLKRTSQYAETVVEALGLKAPVVDERLNELDYGKWSGLTEKDVAAKFGEEEVRGWNSRSLWPARGGWGGSEAEASKEARAFAQALSSRHGEKDFALAISSNGKMRYFLKLIPGEWEKRTAAGTFKTKTGRLARLTNRGEAWSLAYWDVEPQPGQPL